MIDYELIQAWEDIIERFSAIKENAQNYIDNKPFKSTPFDPFDDMYYRDETVVDVPYCPMCILFEDSCSICAWADIFGKCYRYKNAEENLWRTMNNLLDEVCNDCTIKYDFSCTNCPRPQQLIDNMKKLVDIIDNTIIVVALQQIDKLQEIE